MLMAALSGAASLLVAGAALAVVGGAAEQVPGFAARVTVHDAAGNAAGGCSGVLVDRLWVLTLTACFGGQSQPAVTVTVAGATRPAGPPISHPDRGVALVRLSEAVTAEPARLAAAAGAGETLAVAGWGRSATVWVPEQPHRADFRVEKVSGTALGLVSADGAASLCRGDAGAPLLRGDDVVALATAGGQRNCLGGPADGTDTARAVSVGDLTPWILGQISAAASFTGYAGVQAGLFDDDDRPDVTAVEVATGKLWLFPRTAVAHILQRRIEIGRSGWNGLTNLTAGDFTGDGRADIGGVETSTGKLWLYPNTGRTGLSLLGTRIEIGRSGWNGLTNLTAADFTGDGKADISGVETSTGKLWLYPNTGQTGQPQLGTRIEIGRSGWNSLNLLTAGDFTGDGRADLMAAEPATGKLWSYRNGGGTGLAMLSARVLVGGSSWQTLGELTAADFTDDGRTDLFGVFAKPGTAWIYPLDGTGTSDIATRTQVRAVS
jgi:Trypsin/FG-GAP-like repeat